jgi:putative peptidoglycan lipid II flippase
MSAPRCKIAVGVLVSRAADEPGVRADPGVAGLALSIGLGACVNAGFLYTGLRRRGIFVPQPGWGKFFAKLAIAVSAMGALAWWCASRLDWAAMQATPLLRAGALLAIVAAGGALYFAVLFALGFRLADFKRRG